MAAHIACVQVHRGVQRGRTLVFDSIGAPLFSSISTTCSWPLRAPQWRGVRPSCGYKQFTVAGCRMTMISGLRAVRDMSRRVRETPGDLVCVWCVYLGPCIYLGSSLQQQSHHVAVPPFGRDVQRRNVVLGRQRTAEERDSALCRVVCFS